MNEYDFLLQDRIAKIQAINKEYDLEHNAYISFSGGKDSVVVSKLIDLALPNNRIPRVFINTGIEYIDMVKYVRERQKQDDRIIILNSGVKIKPMLEKVGYPFKSKQHSHNLMIYQGNIDNFKEVKQSIDKDNKLLKNYDYIHNLPKGVKTLVKYYYGVRERERESCISIMTIPECLKYQLEGWNNFKISDQCCNQMKKKPLHKWENENNRMIAITGLRADEGGTRKMIKNCVLTDENGNIKKFHPLLVVSDEWEKDFINKNNIKLCKLYYPPYNFTRTGCSGCPFSLSLQKDLDTMKQLLPIDYNRCEHLWKPVYDEYRRIGYRLRKKGKYYQVKLEDLL